MSDSPAGPTRWSAIQAMLPFVSTTAGRGGVRATEPMTPLRLIEATLPFAFAVEALAAWATSFQTIVDVTLAVAIAYQVTLAVRRRGQRGLRVQSVGGTFLTGFLAMTICGQRAGLLLMPAGLACLLVGLGLLQNAVARRRAARALRGRCVPQDAPESEWPRDRAALALVMPTLALALLLVPVATWTWPVSHAAPDVPPSDVARLEIPERSAPPRERSTPPASRGPKRPGDSKTAVQDFEFGTPDPELARRVLFEVTPTHGESSTGDLGAIYLRGLPLVDVDGKFREDLDYAWAVADVDDGHADGWCWLGMRPRAADELDLAIHHAATETASTGETVMLCPPGTASVEATRVRVVPGGAVLTDRGDAPAGNFDYRLVARLPSRVSFPGLATRFATGDPRASESRPSLRAWNDLAALARTATALSTTDLDRVRAVIRTLGAKFKYERLDGRLDDTAALAKFVAVGHGTCMQFAEAGVVMLRSLGVPARVGRGFLVREWDEKRDLYVGRVRDGHAWVEVAFEGCGWVVFDPTPEAPDDASTPRRRFDPSADDSDASIFGPSGTGFRLSLRRIVDFAVDVPFHVGRWIVGHLWPFAAAAAVALAFGVRALRRRARRLRGEPVETMSTRRPWEHLMTDLARRGFRRRPSQTAFEFAASVVANGGAAFEPLIELTARRQAVRFGGREPTAADDADVESFRASL